MTIFDENRPEHSEARRRLQTDQVGWLCTVSPAGAPLAVPVWFFWHQDRILVCSEPRTAKVRAVRQHPRVQLHLESGEHGNDVVIVSGEASISERSTADWITEIRDGYVQKYSGAIESFGMGLDDIAEKFSTTIVVTPTKLLAW